MAKRKGTTFTIKFDNSGKASVKGSGSAEDAMGALAFAQAFRNKVMEPKEKEGSRIIEESAKVAKKG